LAAPKAAHNQPRQQAVGGIFEAEASKRESNPTVPRGQLSPDEVAPSYGTGFFIFGLGQQALGLHFLL
jgi:hypothetical protein